MSEKQAKDEILELVRLIDRHKCELFRKRDVFYGWFRVLIPVFVIYIFLFIYVCAFVIAVRFSPSIIPSAFGNVSTADILALVFSFLAFVIAMFSLLTQFVEENVVRANFKRILKLNCDEGNKLEENKKPLLKALIKMKATNPEFDLRQIYDMNSSMFTKKNCWKDSMKRTRLKMKCSICGWVGTEKWEFSRSQFGSKIGRRIEIHHVNYEKNEVVELCNQCHAIVTAIKTLIIFQNPNLQRIYSEIDRKKRLEYFKSRYPHHYRIAEQSAY